MTSRGVVIVIVLLVLLSGCAGLSDDGGSDDVDIQSPADDEGAESDNGQVQSDETNATDVGVQIENEARLAVFESTADSLDPGTAEEFQAAVLDDGELTPNGEVLLDRLVMIDELGPEPRDAVAGSIAEAGMVDDETLDVLDRILASPEPFQRDVLEHGLADTSGDGLLDGEAVAFDLDPESDYSDRAELAEPLAEDGYTEHDIEYLTLVFDWRDHDWYSVWVQADELGLLHDTVANGTVTEADVWSVDDESGNGLINAMEVEFGSDPSKVDSSGDGFSDKVQWGPMQDLGLDVNPTEPDIYIELYSTTDVDTPDKRQLAEVQSTFEEEPPDDIGPINIHFVECSTDVDPVSTDSDVGSHNRAWYAYGFHYMVITDGSITVEGGPNEEVEEAPGVYVGSGKMAADGTRSSDELSRTMAHEIGHSLGISPGDFDGVDSTEYSSTEYNSIMNYNVQELTFSTAEPFNDYEHMAEQNFGYGSLRTYELDEIEGRGTIVTEPNEIC